MNDAVSKLDLRGFIVGANVNGGELVDPKLDPFWKRAEELGTVILVHPQGWNDPTKWLDGGGALGNNIGFPLDTTAAAFWPPTSADRTIVTTYRRHVSV
jgi:aminocarboxymuconate-semialdehyde decarboxylase